MGYARRGQFSIFVPEAVWGSYALFPIQKRRKYSGLCGVSDSRMERKFDLMPLIRSISQPLRQHIGLNAALGILCLVPT